MSTDPDFRQRGYGRATLAELLTWMRSTGITTVDLHATPDGEHLYRQMGFTEPADTALTLRLNRPVDPRPDDHSTSADSSPGADSGRHSRADSR